MSDDKGVSRPQGPHLSRRAMLQLGLVAIPATQMSRGGVRRAGA